MNSSISDAPLDDSVPEDIEMQNFMKLLNPNMSSLIHDMLDAPLTSDEIAQLKRVPRKLINKTESTKNEDIKVNSQPEDLIHLADQGAVLSTQPLRPSFKSVNPKIALARGMISEPLSDENVELNRGDEMREVNKTDSTKNDDIKMNSSISDARSDDGIPEDTEMQNFMKLLNPKMSSLIHNMLDAPLTSDEIAQLKRVPRELINKTESTENEDFKVNLQPEDLLHSADQEAVPSTQPLPPSTPLTPGRAKLKAWLYRTMRILMSDGRILVGAFLCTDSNANVILGMCSESHELGGEERALGLVMVPGKHIVKMEVDSSNEFV